LIVLLAFLTACSDSKPAGQETSKQAPAEKPADSANGKTLFIGLVNPPIAFNPINDQDISSQELNGLLFESLLGMVEPLKFLPRLAESFETNDNQTYTIKLNPKAKWTDGQPVTADDVAFTLGLIANPKADTVLNNNISFLEGLNEQGKLEEGKTDISGVKVIDPHTLQLRAKSPVDPNMIKEQFGVRFKTLPKHILKDVAPEQLAKHPFVQKPNVTNGPFVFVKHEKDQYVEFAANKEYYRGAPKLGKIFVKIMPAPNLVAQLQTGEIHMNYSLGISKISIQDYETVKNMPHVRWKLEPQVGFQTMEFNVNTISDPRVRQALVYAIDRKLIVDQLLKGTGEIIDGPYTSLNPYLDKELPLYEHNPEKAKQLLQEAGWDFNRELNFVVPIGNVVREQSANIIAENLKAVGVKTKINKFDFPTVMQKGRNKEFDLLLMGMSFTLDPDLSSLYSTKGPNNFPGYSNPESDQLLAQGKAEADPAKRKEIYKKLQAIWQRDVPIITLYSDQIFVAISKKVIKGEPRAFNTFYDVHEWDLQP
jgi:peptide/nickel transport system substrate-binding protein